MVPPFQGCWNTATNPGDFGRLRCRGIDIDHGPAPVVPVLVFNRRNAMALNLTQKKEVVAELAGVAGKAVSLVAAEYAGLTVGQLTDMRKKARDSGVYLKVAKNRSEEHTSELQSLMRISSDVFCWEKKMNLQHHI